MSDPLDILTTQSVTAFLALQRLVDTYTPIHEERVARIAVRVGQHMGLSEYRLETLRLAALVHDIGKLDIPLKILNKPGRLSDTEFSLMKTHVQSGYDVLKHVDFPRPITEIMYCHHEYLDGTGYPRGLTADQIPLESRILTVADIVESMSEDRPYRRSLGLDNALNEIKRLSTTRLDPYVVQACVDVMSEPQSVYDIMHGIDP